MVSQIRRETGRRFFVICQATFCHTRTFLAGGSISQCGISSLSCEYGPRAGALLLAGGAERSGLVQVKHLIWLSHGTNLVMGLGAVHVQLGDISQA